jgi:hypothetical protein
MESNKNSTRMGRQPKSWAHWLGSIIPMMAIATAGSASAQTALPGSELILPATAPLTADMVILKTANSGSSNRFSVAVTNTGSEAVTGAMVTDVDGASATCTKTNPVAITGAGVPEGSFTIANLAGSGIALGTLQSGQTATLTYACQGK